MISVCKYAAFVNLRASQRTPTCRGGVDFTQLILWNTVLAIHSGNDSRGTLTEAHNSHWTKHQGAHLPLGPCKIGRTAYTHSQVPESAWTPPTPLPTMLSTQSTKKVNMH